MDVGRRSLIGGSAAFALAGMLPAAARGGDHAEDIDSQAALERLRKGNAQFVQGVLPSYPIGDARRREIAKGQHPFVTFVCCSDSRVGPEQLFGQGLGEVFVVRNAGNTDASSQSLGSVEYSVFVLHVPLIVVLGHTRCGAVKEAVEIVEHDTRYPGSLEPMLEPLLPAVLAARGQPGDLVENAVRENIRRVAQGLRSPEQPILHPPQHEGKLLVVGAAYDLETGIVDFFDFPKPTGTGTAKH